MQLVYTHWFVTILFIMFGGSAIAKIGRAFRNREVSTDEDD